MIAVIDFGSQYTHLIARRVRELGVLSHIFAHTVAAEELQGYQGIIMSGGPNTVNDDTALEYDEKIFALGVPILGLCYSHQLIGHHFGGEVKPGTTAEFGRQEIEILSDNEFFSGLLGRQTVWMSHGDSVSKVPPGFVALGSSETCPIVAMMHPDKKIYSTQFHLEVHHTQNGMAMLSNFVLGICGAKKSWSTQKYLSEIKGKILTQVGDKKVVLLVSGGVDSTVCFALLNTILGKERVVGIHVDTGFMRKDESAMIMRRMHDVGFDNLHIIDASDDFFNALGETIDPEKKREIIGRVYLEVKDKAVAKIVEFPEQWLLAQGTIYPDVIESGGSSAAHKIKTHHNRVAEIMELLKANKLVEPLAELYKDEVRDLGKEIGVPDDLLQRHPFPGPGLAIRTLCSDGSSEVEHKAEVNARVDSMLTDINARMGSDLTGDVLPVRSVGVQGDYRTYRHPAVIQGRGSWDAVDAASTQLTNAVREVNRVLWLASPVRQDFGEARLHAATLTRARVQLLQEIDAAVTEVIREEGVYGDIWQFPVVLIPYGIGGRESIVLRPFQSRDVMTLNVYHMDQKVLQSMLRRLEQFSDKISFVFYDLTHKPPGTVEWE